MDSFSNVIAQVKDIFQKMSPIQRTNFFLLVAIVLVFFVFVAMWAGRSSDTLLYSNLAQKDAAEIKTKLDELNVEHRVEGNAIYVNPKVVHETRLLLANEGLPQGSGVGYEIFGKPGFVMTDYMQKLTYKRALEGELSRTIGALNGIRQSRVHLAMPKRTLFREKESEPTASVVLDVGPAFPRTKAQIGGIIHLVASSVEGLRPENVTIVDSRGNLLSGTYEESSQLGLTSRQSEIVKAAESYMENKAQSMLTAILGHGRAIVRVNAQMDFDIVERTEEKYDPESAVPRTETRTEEVYAEKDNTATAEIETAASTGKSKDKTKEKMTTNYEINRSIEKIVSSTGSIKRLSVAVVVDGTYKQAKGEDGKNVREYVPRTDAEKDMYKKLVMNAVGLDSERGDNIEVSDAAFDTTYFEEETRAFESAGRQEFILSLVKQIGVIVVFALVFLFLWTLLRKGGVGLALPKVAAPAMGVVTPMPAAEFEEAISPMEPDYRKQEEEQEEMVYRLNIARKHPRAIVEEEMKDMVTEDPDTVAQLVRMWLEEDEL